MPDKKAHKKDKPKRHTYAPYHLPESILGSPPDFENSLRKTYETAVSKRTKKPFVLETAKQPWGTTFGATNVIARRNQIELLEKIAAMVKYKTKTGDYEFNVQAYELLLVVCHLTRVEIKAEYNFKHKNYGTLHTLIGKCMDIQLGNHFERRLLKDAIRRLLKLNLQDIYMPGEFKISSEELQSLQARANSLLTKIEAYEKKPGFFQDKLGRFSGIVLMFFGFGFGWFGGRVAAGSEYMLPVVRGVSVLFSGLFGLSARQSGSGSGRFSSSLFARSWGEEVTGYSLGGGLASIFGSGGYYIGQKGGGFVGWLLDCSSDVAIKRIQALFVSLKKQKSQPVAYGFDLKTRELVFFDNFGYTINTDDLLSPIKLEQIIQTDRTKELTPAELEASEQLAKEFEKLKPLILEMQEHQQAEEAQAAKVAEVLAM